MRREFLQLAHTYRPDKNKIAGWFISEKLDGTRCLWDGGVSRDLETRKVPWASVTDPKTGGPKKKVKRFATGLWSRYGNPIMAPDWFLDQLPPMPLDGELWAGRGNFQLCRSICGGDKPDPRFGKIQFAVYSSPPLSQLFMSGEIKNTNFHAKLDQKKIERFVFRDSPDDLICLDEDATFQDELCALETTLDGDTIFMLQQTKLSQDEDEAKQQVEDYLASVLDQGGEGVILRDPTAQWTPKRVRSILKYKPYSDDEGELVGFTAGRGKYEGRIGALILNYQGKRLELSGMTDEEREFYSLDHGEQLEPGKDVPATVSAKHFRIGSQITFKYRELSDDGIPKEARYFRRRGTE